MSITWHGVDEFVRDLRGFADELDDGIPELQEGVDDIAAAAASGAPVRTRELAGSVRSQLDGNVGRVFATADHAAPIIVGVPSHNIEPHPFIDAALRARESAVLAELERGVERAADRI